MVKIPEEIQKAFEAVQQVMGHAHSPYSKLNVGAALKVSGVADLVLGCNMENASYGATICAERVAAGTAVASFGVRPWEYIVIASSSPSGVIPPCGLCLQVLREFVDSDFKIYLGDKKGIQQVVTFGDLCPVSFSPDMLP